ncbi:MAG: hypothetical protein JO087_05895 [Actinobacteria bacterium]|nr:hypothetical protein [Actinomycetota bacterium]
MRRALLALGLLSAAVPLVVSLNSQAGAATKAGTATFITPDDGREGAGKAVNAGDTTTPFSLELPTSAACRGDSANDGYRVQTYMVPSSVDPATLTFGSVGPLPTATGAAFREPLFAATSDPVVNNQTAAATRPPGPGPIINIPAMNFAVYKAGDAPAGVYNVGVACTRGQPSSSQLDTFWNAQIDVSAGLGGPAAGPLWKTVRGDANVAASQTSPALTAGPGVSASGSSGGSVPPTAARNGVTKATHSAAKSRREEADASGAPPSFHLPVTQLLPHVRIAGTWLEVFAGVLSFALIASALLSLVFRRNRPGVGRKWLAPSPFAVPQEGQ